MADGKRVEHEAKPSLRHVQVVKCRALRRNPQHMKPAEMEALKDSIRRDGFLAPVLVRPCGRGSFEVLSGNHRVMAAREIGMETVPALVVDIDDKAAARVAVNLNTVHGDPTAELLAPFLAELDDETLSTVHLDRGLMSDLREFDREMAEQLAKLEAPVSVSAESVKNATPDCICPTCGRKHVHKE